MRLLLLGLVVAPALAAGCAGGDDAIIVDIHGLAVDPSDSTRLFVATHHGLFVGTEGKSWQAVTKDPFDMMGYTVHPTDPMVMYASGHPSRGGRLGVAKSMDGGVTWSVVSLGGQVDFHVFALSRADPDRLWGVFAGKVWRSDDAGNTWKKFVASGLAGPAAFASSAASADVLYAGAQTGIHTSTDGGRNWTRLRAAPSGATALATTNADPALIVAYSASEGIVRSADGGTTWSTAEFSVDAKDGVAALAIDPTSPDTVYLGTYRGGIHRSADGGASWTALRNPTA